MKRTFLINLLFAVGINLLIKPFWVLGVERGVQIAVGAEAYGLYYSLFNFSFVFNVLLDFGINNYNNTFIARHPQLLAKKITQLTLLKGLLAVVYILVTIIAGLSIGYQSVQMKLLLLLCLNQILSFSITFVRSSISGLQRFITDSLLSVADRLIMIFFCAALLWWHVLGDMQITHFVYAQTLSYIITLAICIIVLLPHLQGLKWKWNKAFTVHLLRKSYPYALLGIFMGIYMKADGVLIERLLVNGKSEAGHYASAYRLVDAANMIAVLFAGLLLPMFSRMIHEKKEVHSLLELAFTLIIIPALLATSVCYFYSADIIFMLNKTHNEDTQQVLWLLMLSFAFTCTVYVYGTFLTAAGRLKQLNRIAFIACVLNVVLNIMCIPVYGIRAAALIAVCTQALVAASHYYLTHTEYKVPFALLFYGKMLLIAMAQILIPVLFATIGSHFMVKILLQIVITIVLLILLKIIDLRNIKQIIIRT